MDKATDLPVAEVVREFIGSRIVPPELVEDPQSGRPVLIPARYDFDADSPHSRELERISRAASAASGIVPTPEELTEQAVVQIQQAMAGQQGGSGPPSPQQQPPAPPPPGA